MDATFKPDESTLPIATQEIPLAVRMAQAELDQAVSTAKAYPRSIAMAVRNILSLTMLDEKTAQECVYALPRGGKPIRGPSVRLAEIIASQWGNCHIGSRVVAVDRLEKVVIAEGVFYDLETGMKRIAQVQRRISDNKGRLYNDDMIAVTGNAACSVAIREAILKGVPKAVWRQAYDAAEAVIAGDVKTLVERRAEMVKAFHAWGVTVEQLCACLEVGGIEDIGLDELATLRTVYGSIKAGEAKLEEYFPASTDKAKAEEGAREAAKARAAKAAQPEKDQAKEDTKPKPEPEKKAAEPETKPEPTKDQSEAQADAEIKAAEAKADQAVTDLLNGEDEQKTAAETTGDVDLLKTPFALEVLRDAGDFGETAARATHAAQLDYFAANDKPLFEAIDAELKSIGG